MKHNIFNPLTIKKFLSQRGYTWKGEIYRNGNLETNPTPDDFNGFNDLPTAIKLYNNNRGFVEYVVVGDFEFKFYSEDDCYGFGDIDATHDYYVTTDISKEWQQFLLKEYKEEYQQHLLKIAQQGKDNIVKNLRHSLKDLNAQRHSLLNKAEQEIEKYNNLVHVASSFNQNDTFNV